MKQQAAAIAFDDWLAGAEDVTYQVQVDSIPGYAILVRDAGRVDSAFVGYYTCTIDVAARAPPALDQGRIRAAKNPRASAGPNELTALRG